MRRSALLLAVVLLLSAPPLAGPAGAHLGPDTAPFYLSSTRATLGTVGDVETLTHDAPVKADDSVRNLTGGAAWYVVPPADRDVNLSGTATGTGVFRFVPLDPAGVSPIGIVGYTLAIDLRRVTLNGTEERVTNTTVSGQPPFAAGVLGPFNVTWALAPSGTLLAGETLALNITGTATGAQGTIQLLYDSVGRPASLSNLTVDLVGTGALELTTGAASKDAAPGGSATYSVFVRNTAAEADTVAFAANGTPAEWTVRVTPASLAVNAGATAGPVLVTVVVPGNATEGTRHTATLGATSSLGGAPRTLQLATTVRAAAQACTVGGQQDQDCDGWSDFEERKYDSRVTDRTSTPESEDSDGDGASNKAEIDAGTDHRDPNDFPGSSSVGGGGGPGSASLLAPLSDPIAQALGVDATTADLIALGLILLFLVVLLLLLFLLLGGYPVKVSFAQPKAVAEPGRSVDFSVEVRSRLRKPQVVDLEVADLPGDWDARLTEARLQLPPKGLQTVGLLVRPPAGWPAPSKREFEVRARSQEKPRRFARALAKLQLTPGEQGPEPPLETAVPEAPSFPAEAPGAPFARGPFRVTIDEVRHDPAVPERGGEVTTSARLRNDGSAPERLRVILVVNGKVRDEVTTDLGPGEAAEASFHWVAYQARNEVRVVAERA